VQAGLLRAYTRPPRVPLPPHGPWFTDFVCLSDTSIAIFRQALSARIHPPQNVTLDGLQRRRDRGALAPPGRSQRDERLLGFFT